MMLHAALARPCRLLFVYGTLRPDSGHPMGRVLAHNARSLGAAIVRARLSRVGPYRAIVPCAPARCWVEGEMFEVFGGRGVWRVLDGHEGCAEPHPDYRRVRVAALLDAGPRRGWTSAWCYAAAEPAPVEIGARFIYQ